MERKSELGGVTQTVSYIPEQYAIIGNSIMLKFGDNWVDGWIIHKAGERVDAKYVEEHEMDHKRQRKASDI